MPLHHRWPTDLFSSEWPFEPAELCEWLFCAAASRGPADPVQMQMLADSVWHLLNQEFIGESPTEMELRLVIIRLVRELGQPLLAESLQSCRMVTPTPGWPSHLVAAHELGIITIDGISTPHQLMGGPIPYVENQRFDASEWKVAWRWATNNFSEFATVTERQLFGDAPTLGDAKTRLQLALVETDLPIIVNLNESGDGADFRGSLFSPAKPNEFDEFRAIRLALTKADHWHPAELSRFTWRWHLQDHVESVHLKELAQHIVAGGNWQLAVGRRKQSSPQAIELVDGDLPLLQTMTVHFDKFFSHIQDTLQSTEDALANTARLARLVLEVAEVRRNIINHQRHGSNRINRCQVYLRGSYPSIVNEQFRIQAWDRFQEAVGHHPHFEVTLAPSFDHWDPVDLTTTSGFDGSNRKSAGRKVSIVPTHPLMHERLFRVLCDAMRAPQITQLVIQSDVTEPKATS